MKKLLVLSAALFLGGCQYYVQTNPVYPVAPIAPVVYTPPVVYSAPVYRPYYRPYYRPCYYC